ncbi:AraC family transcriptional regulator [Dyadobacter chenwenxiniae]|uniref:AraC family transcriptional regulator n=1 Tax=Dyadobacter chenwenxiniae TaxID=2906456 RepID=A0A9X1PMI4_9BACT|nr:helix-turn-helix domain-containing protein [Dyadobacter chenwenxiniae]MCF0063170.1 AraC family transcriptional regulator [Dyadobacter chenwenxiniae]UON84662.1 AraC family transcriptional regulator [Dyadobacter chenwenxiniae]
MVICQEFVPQPQLRRFVQSYQLRHFTFADGSSIPFKPYAPRPEQTLAFFPRGSESVENLITNTMIKRPRSVVIGQYSQRTNRHLNGPEFCVLLVNLRPGVLYRLLGVPFTELTNTFIDAEDILPKEITRVNERLNGAETPEEMIGIIEKLLLELTTKITRNDHPIDAVTNLLIQRPEDSSVLTLAESSCFSPRQFERLFKERMGISPKLFTRIARMTKAFSIKYNHAELDWLSIAIYCNYHDYQHLARDFKDLAGVTPTTYLREEKDAPERQFGLQDSSLTAELVAFLPPAKLVNGPHLQKNWKDEKVYPPNPGI